MTAALRLSGLDELLRTCERLEVPVKLMRPADTPLMRNELPTAQPVDPYLSILYTRVGELSIGRSTGALRLCRRDNESNLLSEFNAERVSGFPKPFDGFIAFAEEPATLYCFALVPWLADAQGFQPVVWVDPYEEIHALPIASSLDEFFKAYARCLEFVVANPWLAATDIPDINFWSLPELLAKDQQLVEMLSAGRFNSMMKRDDEAREWVERVAQAAEPAV